MSLIFQGVVVEVGSHDFVEFLNQRDDILAASLARARQRVLAACSASVLSVSLSKKASACDVATRAAFFPKQADRV